MEREGILEMGGFYDKTDNNKMVMIVGYKLTVTLRLIKSIKLDNPKSYKVGEL